MQRDRKRRKEPRFSVGKWRPKKIESEGERKRQEKRARGKKGRREELWMNVDTKAERRVSEYRVREREREREVTLSEEQETDRESERVNDEERERERRRRRRIAEEGDWGRSNESTKSTAADVHTYSKVGMKRRTRRRSDEVG